MQGFLESRGKGKKARRALVPMTAQARHGSRTIPGLCDYAALVSEHRTAEYWNCEVITEAHNSTNLTTLPKMPLGDGQLAGKVNKMHNKIDWPLHNTLFPYLDQLLGTATKTVGTVGLAGVSIATKTTAKAMETVAVPLKGAVKATEATATTLDKAAKATDEMK